MDGIEGLLAQNFGVRPQGKAAPMASAAASRPAGSAAPAWTRTGSSPASSAAPSYDDLFSAPAPAPSSFDSFNPTASSKPATSSAPAYDDDVFDSVPGLRPSGSSASFSSARDDVFGSNHSASPPAFDDDLLAGFASRPPAGGHKTGSVGVNDDDLLGGFGRSTAAQERRKPSVAVEETGGADFDGLIPGFAGCSPPRRRKADDDTKKRPSVPSSKQTASMADDPFAFLETASTSESAYASPGRSSDPLENLDNSTKSDGNYANHNDADDSFFENPYASDQVTGSDSLFASDISGYTKNSNVSTIDRDSSPVHHSMNENPAHKSSMEDLGNVMPKSQSARYSAIHVDGMDQSPISTESEDDIWLTVSEIPLFTQPTTAPPPSRSPPLLKQKPLGANANGKNDHVRRSMQNHNHYTDLPKQPEGSSVDDLECFARGKPQVPVYDNSGFDGDFEIDSLDHEEKDRQERLEQEMRLREEKEKEQRRLEKERELEQQRERERQAVEKATKEARERAAAEARAKAEREACQRAQRAAVQRVQQEARERAAAEAKERAARVAAEARERAAAEAKERAGAEAKERERTAARERAAAEKAAAERAQQEARKRAERAAVERAAAESRERQAAAAAAAAREKQSMPDDLESFFGAGARANSAPKQRAPTPTVDSMFGSGSQGIGTVNGSSRAASTSTSVRKTPSVSSFGDDLSDLFGGPASFDVFQEVEGETEERRRARLERHQRTRERAAKALAEKNERDMQVRREQAERDRIGDTLDFEVKRWSAGKEGNLRALLSTLQYILWPECGWQAVSLTDLITGAAVKKQYRKATLCIHPDKVQQKGASIQQKYIAEKVFDILKEAWTKFNSEELF